MKNTLKILALVAVFLGFNSCIEEFEGNETYYGTVSLELQVPETAELPNKKDLSVVVRLFREYNGVTSNLSLKVDSIYENGMLRTESAQIEYGNYKLEVASLVDKKKKPIYVAISSDDERASGLDKELLLPIEKNVLANENTVFSVATVVFDDSKDVTYLVSDFLALEVGEIGAVEGVITEVDVNAEKGNVTSLSLKDANGDELFVYGVFNVSKDIYLAGQTIRVIGKRDSYKDADQLKLEKDSDHSIEVIDEGNTAINSVSAFLALEKGEVGTVQGIVSEVTAHTSGTVSSLVIKDKKGDELVVYGVWRISEVLYQTGQELKITGARTSQDNVAQLELSVKDEHSITRMDNLVENSIAAFLLLTDGEIGTLEGEVMVENYSDSHNSVTSLKIKDVNGDELLLYGVFKVSSDRYSIGSKIKAIGEKTTYNGAVQMSFTAESGHSIEVIDGGNGGGNEPAGDGTQENPYIIDDLINNLEQDGTEAWVQGYIVGWLKSGTVYTEATDDFNILIADVQGETDKEKMVCVQLKAGTAREQLGLSSTGGGSLGMLIKATGQLTAYNAMTGLKDVADGDFEIIEEGGNGGGNEPTGSLLFAGSDFEDWTKFEGALNSNGLNNYAVQSANGGVDNSSALHIKGSPTSNAYIFNALAGTTTLPSSPTKITMYIKGTASAKSLSMNLYYGESTSPFYTANLDVVSGSSDVTIVPTKEQNSYTGSIDTGGAWVKVTIDLTTLTDFTFNTGADLNMFAIKVGKSSDYDLYIDNITIE